LYQNKEEEEKGERKRKIRGWIFGRCKPLWRGLLLRQMKPQDLGFSM